MATILRSHVAGRWIGETPDTPLASAVNGDVVAHVPKERPDFGEAVAYARGTGLPGLLAMDFQRRAGVLRALGDGMERVWKMAEWPEARQAQWVARTRLMNYPDLINAQIVEMQGGTGLFLYSRSLVGHSDLGVNAKRVAAWRSAFDAALARAR